ncbi:hypothetical protein HDU87_006922 [Geranomyces variabilis]|uniref:Fido domain-containing protein n=1 Tax=Geranomyces variabilis TaxID=109894 RepID=A0AAD5TKC3_9FUNG|nr:hypothetical protein HDU87_006922 [Geranomyces variabilis]
MPTQTEAWFRTPVFYNDSAGPLTDVQAPASVAAQSLNAAERYRQLEPIATQYPDLGPPDCFARGNPLAYERHLRCFAPPQRAQAVVGVGADSVLDEAVGHLQMIADSADSGEEYESDLEVKPYQRLLALDELDSFSIPIPSPKDAISRWEGLQDEKTATVAINQFARNAALPTNVLEGVFALDGQSWPLLKPKKVVEILENADACLAEIIPVLRDSTLYNAAFVQTVHSKLLRNDNVAYEEEDEDRYAVLIPRGDYRRVACFTTQEGKGYETRFCPWKLVPDEIECSSAGADRVINPFLAAAWLQFAYLRIHPISDGNGRVAGIISSIPLLMANLPPVVVAAARKSKYFEVLNLADRTNDCSALAAYLKEEIDQAIQDIASLPEDPTDIPSPLTWSASLCHPPSSSSRLNEALAAAASAMLASISHVITEQRWK